MTQLTPVERIGVRTLVKAALQDLYRGEDVYAAKLLAEALRTILGRDGQEQAQDGQDKTEGKTQEEA